MVFLMLHVFHCIPLYFHFAVRHLKFGISKSSSIAAEEPPKLTVPSMWPCLERRQLLCGLKSIHEWMCSHVKLTMVVYYTTSTAHSMEPVSLCCPHELLKFRKKYRKTFPLMKKYGGDKVQGVADIEKLCSSLLPTAPSQRAAKLRSRHQCRCMIWSSNHVMVTNFQTGWTWMNPSYNTGHSLSYDEHLGWKLFSKQASGQRKHQIVFFDAACPLQIAGTCYVHLPLQGQTRTSYQSPNTKLQKWSRRWKQWKFHLNEMQRCKGHFQLFPLSSMSKETIVWKLHNCRRLPSRPWWCTQAGVTWLHLQKFDKSWLSLLTNPLELDFMISITDEYSK